MRLGDPSSSPGGMFLGIAALVVGIVIVAGITQKERGHFKGARRR